MTGCDTLRQELSPAQEQALGLVLSGRCDREVAEAVGVARGTVWRWRHQDPAFVAEMNRERQALAEATADRLRTMRDKAFRVVEGALDDGDVRVGLAMLRLLAASFPPLRASGAITALDVERGWERDREEARRNSEFLEALTRLD